MHERFSNKVIIVTAGASGIGQELVRQLSRYEATVVIADIDRASGQKLVNEIAQRGQTVYFEQVDMTVEHEVERLVNTVFKKFERIDYFFNGVGIVMGGEIRDTKVADWHKLLQVNLASTTNGTHYAYQKMLQQGSGHIINFASAAGLLPTPIMAVYSSTKFAIVGLSHALRIEAKKLNIKVSVICPTFVDTPIYQTAIYNRTDKEKTLDWLLNKFPIQQPNKAASKIIKGVAKNKATIHTWQLMHGLWLFYRLSPTIYIFVAEKIMPIFRKHLRT